MRKGKLSNTELPHTSIREIKDSSPQFHKSFTVGKDDNWNSELMKKIDAIQSLAHVNRDLIMELKKQIVLIEKDIKDSKLKEIQQALKTAS